MLAYLLPAKHPYFTQNCCSRSNYSITKNYRSKSAQENMLLSLKKDASPKMLQQITPLTVTLLLFINLSWSSEQRAAASELFFVMHFISADNFHQTTSAFNVFTSEIASPLISGFLLLPPLASLATESQMTVNELLHQLPLPYNLILHCTVKCPPPPPTRL